MRELGDRNNKSVRLQCPVCRACPLQDANTKAFAQAQLVQSAVAHGDSRLGGVHPAHARRLQCVLKTLAAHLWAAIRNSCPHRQVHTCKYCLSTVIGDGKFGQVLAATLAEDATDRRAVKRVRKDFAKENALFQEVRFLTELSHEHVVPFHDVYEDCDFLYIVMQICDGGDLFTKLLEATRFSESYAAQLGGQMLLALSYIHSRHIVHRDVKAENFMLPVPCTCAVPLLKLVDFGLACLCVPGRMLKEACGSVHYLAPEMIMHRYDCLVDIWAFGVLQFLLMHGRYPFDGESAQLIILQIVSAEEKWCARARISVTCMDFLQAVLAVRASSRFSASDALEHVWMHMTDARTLSEENS